MSSLLQAAAVARGKGEYPERMGQPECQVWYNIGTSVFHEWSDLMSRVLSVYCYSAYRQFRGNSLQIVVWLTLPIVQPWKTLKHGWIFLRMLECVYNKAIWTHLLAQYRQLPLRWSSDVTLFFFWYQWWSWLRLNLVCILWLVCSTTWKLGHANLVQRASIITLGTKLDPQGVCILMF